MTDIILNIYGSSSCSACKAAVSVAKAKNVAFEYHLIDQDQNAALAFAEFAAVTGSRALPLTTFSDQVVNGLPATLKLINEVA